MRIEAVAANTRAAYSELKTVHNMLVVLPAFLMWTYRISLYLRTCPCVWSYVSRCPRARSPLAGCHPNVRSLGGKPGCSTHTRSRSVRESAARLRSGRSTTKPKEVGQSFPPVIPQIFLIFFLNARSPPADAPPSHKVTQASGRILTQGHVLR